MAFPAIYIVVWRLLARDLIILASGVGFVIVAFRVTPGIRNQRPFESKQSILFWRIGFAFLGIVIICLCLHSFAK